jgi:NADH dehydrogenase
LDKTFNNFFAPYISGYGILGTVQVSVIHFENFSEKNLQFRLGNLLKVNPSKNKIILNGELTYDYLVLPLNRNKLFGMENEEKCYSMKTLNDAIVMRNNIENLEKSSHLQEDIMNAENCVLLWLAAVQQGGSFRNVAEMRNIC